MPVVSAGSCESPGCNPSVLQQGQAGELPNDVPSVPLPFYHKERQGAVVLGGTREICVGFMWPLSCSTDSNKLLCIIGQADHYLKRSPQFGSFSLS